MSDLYTVAELLERLNSAQTEQNEGIDAVHRAVQALRGDGEDGGKKNTSLLLGGLGDLKSAAVSILTTGFDKMREASAQLEAIQIKSLTTGVDMKGVIGDLANQNNKAKEVAKDDREMSKHNFAGLLEAARAQADAAKVGLDLSISDKDTNKDSNHELRNVVGLLDAQGQQGQTVLLHFQDLIRRGYSEEQARHSIESFAKISANSMQTADNTKKLLDQFKEIETLQSLLGGGLGEEFQVALQNLAPDVAGLEALGKAFAGVIMPSTKEDILISQNMGALRDDFLREFQNLSKDLTGLKPEEREGSDELKRLRVITEEYFKVRSELDVSVIGAEGILEPGSLNMALAGLLKQSAQVNEILQLGMRDLEASQTIRQVKLVTGEKKEIGRGGDIDNIVKEYTNTLTFEIGKFNEILMGNSEAMQSFREIS